MKDKCRCLPVMRELLHQLLPVAAGAEVSLIESPDVLDDFLSLHALSQRHILGDISCNLWNVLGLSIQPLDKTAGEQEGMEWMEERNKDTILTSIFLYWTSVSHQEKKAPTHFLWVLAIFFSHASLLVFSSASYLNFSCMNKITSKEVLNSH